MYWKDVSLRRLIEAIFRNERITRKEFHSLMAAIDDLNTAVSTLSADVQTLIAKPTGTSDAQIEAAVATVNALDAQVKAAIAPAPAPTPAA